MPRTLLTPVATPGGYSTTGAVLPMTAADAVNFNYIVATGRDIVLVHNTGVGSRTVTITSVPDNLGRVGDVAAVALAAGEYRIFGPMPLAGWVQTDGSLHFQASHAEVKIGIISL